MLRLRYDGTDGGRDFIVVDGRRIAGYAHLDPPSGDDGEGDGDRRARRAPGAPAAADSAGP